MEDLHEKFILGIMKRHNVMTLATVRRDGFPQATTVAYANDGLDLYFCCDKTSQKVKNISRSNKVSATIDHDTRDWNKIKAISLAGHATVLKGKRARAHAAELLTRKFPQQGSFSADDPAVAFVQVQPSVVSLLDYSQGFGHTELIEIPASTAP